jgi:nitronate monooxygenase
MVVGRPGGRVRAGATTLGGQQITLPKGHGLPPGTAATGHIEAMAMYAGESAADIPSIEPVTHVIQPWAEAAAASPPAPGR